MKLYTLKPSFRRGLAVLSIAAAGFASAAGYDLQFVNGVAEPGGGACALTIGSRCRFNNVVIGAGTGSADPSQRDIVVTITKLVSVNAAGAAMGTTTVGVFDNAAPGLTTPPVPVATPTQFFSPSVQPQQTTANITGWAEFTFDLVTPGGAAPTVGAGTATLPGNIWVSSFDTDSDGGTLREFVEFIGVPATDTALSAGTTLSSGTAVNGGVHYLSGAGSIAGISTDPNYKASAILTNPASFKLVYGAQTGASGSTAGARLTAFDFLRPDAILLRPIVDGYKSVKLTGDADGNGAVTPGDTLTYTVTYVNTGNAAVTGFQITDLLPAGVTAAVGAQTVRVNGTVTAGAKNGSYTGAGANTNLLAAGQTLPVNGTISVDIPVTVGAVATDNTTLSNQTTSGGSYVNAAGATVTQPSTSSDNVDDATVFPPSVATAAGGFGTTPVPAGSVAQTQAATTDSTTVNVRRLPTLTLSKSIAAPGRINALDQFTVQIKNGATVTASASTAGTGTTVSAAATTLASGTVYTLTEVMAAGSVSALASYTTTIICTNSAAGSATVSPSGAGQSFTLTPALGDVISCTLTNTAKPSISGQVYEDFNYGGGAGRAYNAALGMSLRPSVRAELFNSVGGFMAVAFTDASGAYSFPGQSAGNYTVRVVNSFVTSSRAGGCTAAVNVTTPPVGCLQLPVQTFVNGDANRVGGEVPSGVDPVLSTTTLPAGAESIAAITVGSANVSGVDFGFNFDAVVNKNASGQGSLGQFITNASALSNTGLVQSGSRQNSGSVQALPAGVETSIFMASGGTAVPGLRAGLPSQLSAGVLLLDQSAGALPDVTGANSAATSIDGTTQTVNVGNTNSGLLGTGGTVGYISTATLDQVQRPEVELVGVGTVATGLNLLSNDDQVRGVAVRGFGNAANVAGQANIHIGDTYTGTLIEQNFLGFSATAAALCNNATTTASGKGDNVRSDGGDNGTLQNNLISCAGGKGFGVEAASAGWQILDNEIRANAIGNPTLDGIDLENAGSGNATVRGNLIIQNGGVGVDGYQGGGGNNVTQNSIVGNGFGQASTPNETAGVRLYSSNNTVKNNLIASNYGAGVMVTGGVSGNLISQNSIVNNGALPAANGAAASGQIGIDLLLPADSVTNGTQGVATTPLYVTKNDSGDTDTGGNDLLNFPVFQSATIQGGNLVVIGYARPGSTVELFVAAPDPSGFGEGRTYLFTGKEGSTADTDAGTGSYNSTPGTDATNRFQFTLPLPAGVALGTPLTATASCLATDCTGTTVVSNSTSEFSYNILVQAAPVANDDSASTNPLVPVTFSLSGNDTPAATLDLTSILLDASGPGTRTLSNGGRTLTVLGEGVYTVNPLNDGTVIFTPATGFNNGTSTAKYTIKDTNGVSSNVANILVSVPANVDLAIVKTGPAYFKPGDTVTYTLKVTSTGSAPAGIKVTDTLPAGLTGVTADNGGVISGSSITWTLPATTPVTLTVTGIAPTAAGDGSYSGPASLANTATVASTSAAQAESGAVATNNTSTTTAQLVYPRLTKRVRNLTAGGTFSTVGTGKPGEMLEYCIDFQNYGVAVNAFVITDTVPTNTNSNPDGYGAGLGIQVNRAGITTRTSASDGDGASLSTTTLNIGLGTLAAGESGSVCFQASIK